jgi:Fe-S-cluster-containing dehydrogenase component
MVGIKVHELVTVGPDKVHTDFIPVPTRFCDLCIDRVKGGGQPSCVKHCQSKCIMFGTVTQLAKAMEEQPRSSIWAPT